MTQGPRSNSFHYTFVRPVGALLREDPAACPVARAGPARWDFARALFLRRGPLVGAYETRTGDFDEAAVARVKHLRGQLYLDISNKEAPDDFSRDLVQLRRSPLCTGCAVRARCAGLFDPVREDVFARDDAELHALIAGLQGDVLDVGCGHGPYGDTLAARVAAGAVRYVGVDPDADRIAALRARWPWAELLPLAAEELDPARRFDHVLVLRSWNHLRNPLRALENFAKCLRPGGTLLVVDNEAFALVRSRRHAAAAEGGGSVFEHFRNDDAAGTAALIAAALPGATPLLRREVGPATSNQWVLWYRVG